jgi:CRISPR system Cascade subunit CasA
VQLNLINDQWIPARRADGTVCRIAPWEIGAATNPVVDISAPRPDFRGALYQFLIGLVQTAFAPEDDDEWEEKWKAPPSCQGLRMAFGKFAGAFELVNEGGPAFMQDLKLPETAEPNEIKAILIDAPGVNTVKNNLDHFVKRDTVKGLCESCTAAAVMALQTNAPAGGQGNRTGMRGGGPLTTLVIPEKGADLLWKVIWINMLTLEERFNKILPEMVADIFPWLGVTRESTNDKKTFPEDVNELQLYWGTPRRIRLDKQLKQGRCDGCGIESPLFISYKAKNFGVSYSSTWKHSLSPYRIQKEKDGTNSLIATKGKQGGFTYSDWIALTIGAEENEFAADVVKTFIGKKAFCGIDYGQVRIWCFGYDMDNMKARCWYDQTMPLIALAPAKQILFIATVQKLIAAADDTTKILHDHVKSAWFERPKDVKGDTSFIYSAFGEKTEIAFFNTAEKLRTAIENEHPTILILREWRDIIIDSAERLFDRFALQNSDEVKNMKRIAGAAKALTNILNSPKTKSIQILKEGA